jgi:LPS O-antigen subunit length determinant protein (WzzB/FepE family)
MTDDNEFLLLDDDGPILSADDEALANEAAGLEKVDMEKEAVAEVSEVLEGFRRRAERENQRMTDAIDSEYWVALCFQTREQKEEFLHKAGLIDLGDKYLDGMKVARALKIKLSSRVPDLPQPRKFDDEYVSIAMDFDDEAE